MADNRDLLYRYRAFRKIGSGKFPRGGRVYIKHPTAYLLCKIALFSA